MKKTIFAALAAATAIAASPASAATGLITFEFQNGSLVGLFGNTNPSGTGTDTYNFTLDQASNVFASTSSLGLRLTFTDLDFTSVKLNNVAFDNISSGVFELRTISQLVAAGPQTLTVGYRNAQFLSSYSGKLVVTPVAAVPEPATWAMMLLGFGMVAGVARYRRRSANVTYA
ncbi:FxDxF family PEP-CTERM protein [Sphingomonas sp. KR1UV-12]|uniref:FxDxF family PEP-CTERM protein n=1 Tax=Sphingomonas aurea TaxID=3063994 RepID=A0ABT9EFL3_9SPHN|nr:FxDxF family PEP-CTERM protein [Sphingomonas sp. KR1UV-12]MDP1025755.1 FxDxF family PEP-CTERM protein [Sphingomonas sp. KR1UV-12]